MSNILVVDDVAVICEFVADTLKGENYNLTSATSGREALEFCKEIDFDLLITDLLMPDMDGFELMSLVRKTLPDIKIIVMTAGGAISSKDYLDLASKRLHVSAALEKPLDQAQLIEETRKALEN